MLVLYHSVLEKSNKNPRFPKSAFKIRFNSALRFFKPRSQSGRRAGRFGQRRGGVGTLGAIFRGAIGGTITLFRIRIFPVSVAMSAFGARGRRRHFFRAFAGGLRVRGAHGTGRLFRGMSAFLLLGGFPIGGKLREIGIGNAFLAGCGIKVRRYVGQKVGRSLPEIFGSGRRERRFLFAEARAGCCHR